MRRLVLAALPHAEGQGRVRVALHVSLDTPDGPLAGYVGPEGGAQLAPGMVAVLLLVEAGDPLAEDVAPLEAEAVQHDPPRLFPKGRRR